MEADPFDLHRFVSAQDPVMAAVARELAAGRNASHWMWFVFPQLRGLGRSAIAQRFGISGPAEARAYLAHPLLAPRLAACTAQVLGVAGFREAQGTFYGEEPDPLTVKFWAEAGG